MNTRGILTVACLLLPTLANAQTGQAVSPPCGMPVAVLKMVSMTADTMDTESKAPDSQIENIQTHWEQYYSEAWDCQTKAKTPQQAFYAATQLAALWGFRAKHDEVYGEQVVANLKGQLADSQKRVADLQKIIGQPYVNEPRPIQMKCRGGTCDGEVLIPNARTGVTPFHMTCRVVGNEVQCDGDLMP